MKCKLIGVIELGVNCEDSNKPFRLIIDTGNLGNPIAQDVTRFELFQLFNRIANKLTPELELEVKL